MKRAILILLVLLQLVGLCACANDGSGEETTESTAASEAVAVEVSWEDRPLNVVDDKYRTYYEIFVYSFYDSDGDGIGDLNGVTEKLDYIADLGFNGIWLMPIMPSTTYHKYDTTDYMDIDPEYGTLEDFQNLLDQAHARGINVIIDLAMNHSSSAHPWFQAAVSYIQSLEDGQEPNAEECPYVDYYHINQKGGSGWSLVPGTTDWFYECQFWSGMPDLNLQSEAVRAEFEAIADFWLDLGVDGFRLDAVKEFESNAHATNVEILTWFNDYVKAISEDYYIVCECWETRETYAQYYQSGVDSMFDFSFGQSSGVIAKVLTGASGASSYGRLMVENQQLYDSYSDSAINAPFYTNHDMGRTCGYYPGDEGEAKVKMGNAMNILMTGNVFVYYGEELGMKGSGKDENKRAPMYWSKDADAQGMTDGPAAMDTVTHKFDSLEEQAEDPTSIYSYVKQAIRIRNQNPEIARGEVTFLEAYSDDSICVITKSWEGRELLLIFNTTNAAVELDLTGLMVQGVKASQLSVLGELLTGEESTGLEGETVTMPAFSILILGES